MCDREVVDQCEILGWADVKTTWSIPGCILAASTAPWRHLGPTVGADCPCSSSLLLALTPGETCRARSYACRSVGADAVAAAVAGAATPAAV